MCQASSNNNNNNCCHDDDSHEHFGPPHKHTSHSHAHAHSRHQHHHASLKSFCVACMFVCCCMQATMTMAESATFGTVHKAHVAYESMHNVTWNASSTVSELRVNVQPCNGSVGWSLWSPTGTLLKKVEPEAHGDHEGEGDDGDGGHNHHGASEDELHSVDQYEYVATTANPAGVYTLSLHGETAGGKVAVDVSAYTSKSTDPNPVVKVSKLEVHRRTASTLEIEWTATTSVAPDNRVYKLYVTPSLEDDDAKGTVCALAAAQLQPVAEITDDGVTSYTVTNLAENTKYNVVLVVENTATGTSRAYAALTASTSAHGHSATTTAWVYTMVAISIASLVSLSGVVLLMVKRSVAENLMGDMLGLALGSLLGTAMFTLIPESNDVYHGVDVTISSVILAGIGFGYVVESLVHVHAHMTTTAAAAAMANDDDGGGGKKQKNTDANIGGDGGDGGGGGGDRATTVTNTPVHTTIKTSSAVEMTGSTDAPAAGTDDAAVVVEMTLEDVDLDAQVTKFEMRRRQRIAILSLLGDAVHNLVDGALVGASFLESTRTGVAVSLAIVLHEIPQEIGDFCILLHAGWSPTKALLANLSVSLTAIIGASVALAVGSEYERVTNYLIPFAAGMFIYLALGGILPELQQLHVRHYMRAAAMVCVGITAIGLLLLMGEGHSHEEDGGGGGHNH